VLTEKPPIYSTRLGDGFLRLPLWSTPDSGSLTSKQEREPKFQNR